MHTLLLAVGPDVDLQLAPFLDAPVAPYELEVTPEERAAMSEHYGLAADDLEALAGKLRDYFHEAGTARDGRLYRTTTANPDARCDGYRVGGRFEGFLRLREPRRERRLFGLLRGPETRAASRARKGEVDAAALLADPPAALLLRGEWHESAIWPEEPPELWARRFAELFAQVPDDALLTVVDVHS